MYQTIALMPGVTLRCVAAERFKQGCLSIQFLRPMCREEAAMNALIPSVLLRGTLRRPDLRAITLHLDDLYGASVSEMVRRVGDCQTVGLYFGFIEDRVALSGDKVLEPMLDFAGELLLEPVVEDGGFCKEFVEGEKRNLIANIESQLNDKRAYASAKMLEKMCSADSYGIPRLGEKEKVALIDPVSLYAHYQRILAESPVEVFYVGSAQPELVAQKIRSIFRDIPRRSVLQPAQTGFQDGGGGDYTETMEISQGKLCMGFISPVSTCDDRFCAMQLLNLIYGAGMNSRLFVHVREKLSLCYSIGTSYYSSKGIMTVSAGIDCDKADQVRQEVLNQLQSCCDGTVTQEELDAAKETLISALQGVYDSPAAIESYEFNSAMSPKPMSLEEHERRLRAVTLDQLAEAARTLQLHTTYFLKGVEA